MESAASAVKTVFPLGRVPADSPQRHRGLRGLIAFGLVIAAGAALVFSHSYANGAVDAGPHRSIEFSYHGRAWAKDGLYAGALVLTAIAAVIWTTRRRPVLYATLLAGVAVLTASGYAARENRTEPSITEAQFHSISDGIARSTVLDRFGTPVDEGSIRLNGRSLECIVYAAEPRSEAVEHHVLCFDNNRLAESY